MPELTPQFASEIVAACQANLADLAAGLSRTFDVELQVAIGSAEVLHAPSLPADFQGPGLIVLLRVGSVAVLGVLSEASEILPAWYAAPDPTGQSKLATLAQEMGMQVLPDAVPADDAQAAHVADLQAAVRAGQLAEQAGFVPLTLTAADGRSAVMSLIWPAANPSAVFAPTTDPAAASTTTAPPKTAATPESTTTPHNTVTPKSPAAPVMPPPTPSSAEPQRHVISLDRLPTYSRSLLRIRVPVTVCLARRRQPVGRIVEITPGTILQFDKPCDEPLDLEINGRLVAHGEAVKVGDKFGLRIATLTPTPERFVTLSRRAA